MLEILLATANPHKVEEMSAIFGQLMAGDSLRFLSLKDLPGNITTREPEESGSTFEDNAAIKARSYAAQSGMICLADDSGLEIDALGGRPGVISSHYCTDGREQGMTRAQRDAANNARVMRELEGVPFDRRAARFVCVMCLAAPAAASPLHAAPVLVRGTFEGRIGLSSDVPRGENGFGYDPLFLAAPDFVHASAELSPAEKNIRSHRAAAARQMALHLVELLRGG